jgi:hypothetical protein
MLNPLHIINQLFEIRTKLEELGMSDKFERNLNRLDSIFEEEGYIIQNPTGQSYSEARSDCDASIAGQISSKMIVTRTLKPIIYQKSNDGVQLQQKGIVIVENK